MIDRLLRIDSTNGLEQLLKETFGDGVFDNEAYWRPVGDKTSNAGPIEASADEINPLIERIINGMEAVVELEVARSGDEPGSPRQAIENLLAVPEGRARLISTDQARSLAESSVRLIFRGTRDEPTIVVRDFGIGVHPTAFSQTLVGLNESEKGSKPYLIGMYGQGGASTFEKCTYTVVVSRRHSDALADGQRDEVGWTVVRKQLITRAHVYSYLISPESGEVFRSPGEHADQAEFAFGTQVSHIAYKGLGPVVTQRPTNDAWYTFNYRLFDPLIPWGLYDERPIWDPNLFRTMRGVPYRIGELPSSTGIGLTEAMRRGQSTSVRHHVSYTHELDTGSEIKVEWWVLQDDQARDGQRRARHGDSLSPYRDRRRRYSRRPIAVTRGGQIHYAMTSTIFSRRGFRKLASSIMVNVDTDNLTWEEGASFFSSNRADIKQESQDAIESAINAAIDLYSDDLREIERERESEAVSGRSSDDEDAIRQSLNPLIRAFQTFTGSGNRATRPGGGRSTEFRGVQTPTFLRFARSGDLHIRAGTRTHVDILTDAADSVIKRSGTVFSVSSTNSLIRVGRPQGGSGRWRIALFPDGAIQVGATFELNASLSRVDNYLQAEPCRAVVVPPPPPYEGSDPPSFIRFRSRNGVVSVRQGGARLAIETDAKNDLLERGAEFQLQLPEEISYVGVGGPRSGEFRVRLDVPETAPLGNAGSIRAVLNLVNGQQLEAEADLVITEKLAGDGESSLAETPNYKIHDVKEIKSEEGEYDWADMAGTFDRDAEWGRTDVGGYLVTGEDPNRELHFFVNIDNRDLNEAERRIARRSPETAVDALRRYQKTLVCFHLYQMAAKEFGGGAENVDPFLYDDYRDESIRVNQTILFSQKEFVERIEGSTEETLAEVAY